MADNPPSPPSGPLPPLPSSGKTGHLTSPTTHLPGKKGGASKIVVMLSSVAKSAPARTQSLVPPPPLPPAQVSPGSPPSQPRGQLSSTTFVKLPPKTSMPRLGSLSTTPLPVPKASASGETAPPPLPAKRSAQHIPPIKLNEPLPEADSSGESIFPQTAPPAPKPEGWKSLEAGELNPPAGNLESLEVFARSQRLLDKSTPPSSETKNAPLVAPPLRPPSRVETPPQVVGAAQPLNPPPLSLSQAKPAESSAPPPLASAPPLLERATEGHQEKLSPPHLPTDLRPGETTPDSSEAMGVHKAPALIQPEAPPPKSSQPSAAKKTGGWFKKKWLKDSAPLVLSSTSKGPLPKALEGKPALKPAVLPSRLISSPAEAEVKAPQPAPSSPETKEVAEKTDAAVSPPQPPEPTLPAQPPETETPPSSEKKTTAATALPVQPPPNVPVSPQATAPLPLTRVARAKNRRLRETVVFWAVLVPLTIAALFYGSLHFGQETRVEGQVIPPPGMVLNNEVWIVTDFSSLAAGVAEDLAKDRTPLLQEIQERRDHVQRAQADIASREERIRLIQQDIQTSKDEVASVVKQARDKTQEIWDGEGARIDAEYQSRFDQLKKAIADRAKSLNLPYKPDETYQSPEVWANAYRLALYQVPPGVDGLKEHQWLSDQMKQWRDFLKTLDDRKEQLREQAAQIKLAPAPKITDLNTKIDELQQRSDGAAAEEVPLKAELLQAQTDLVQVQTEEAGLDDKSYKELYALPGEAVTKHISLATNGRFSWVEDDPFVEDEKEHHYLLFARATRADGRQYWALHRFSISKNQTLELIIEPGGFISTKAILRPDLPPDEQEQ